MMQQPFNQMPGQGQPFMPGTPRGGGPMTGQRIVFTPQTPRGGGALARAGGAMAGRPKKAAASLGVIRLDYDYPPAPGDIDSPQSFAYDVYYRAVPGLTFSICQSGRMTDTVERNF